MCIRDRADDGQHGRDEGRIHLNHAAQNHHEGDHDEHVVQQADDQMCIRDRYNVSHRCFTNFVKEPAIMIDFVFQNPTKIYFGKSALSNLKSEAAHWGERVLRCV